MKIELQPIITIKGYSKLYGVDYTRIKAVSNCVNTNVSNNAIDKIRATGEHIKEYRLVKEPGGFIFRETLSDCGINGCHKTIKEAIGTALRFVTIHIDEAYSYQQFPEFEKLKRMHQLRSLGKCKHEHLDSDYQCLDCGLIFHPEANT